MSISARQSLLCVAVCLASGLPLQAQNLAADRPAPCVPLHPLTRQQLDERASLKLYGLGLLCEREDRLLEALHAFEKAARLDAKAAPVHKALVPLYLALDRNDDALKAARKVLDLDPADHGTWYIYARLLRTAGRNPEAIAALNRGLDCPDVKERPDLRQQMYYDLGVLHEQAQAWGPAAAALTEAAGILEHPDGLLEVGPFDRQEVLARAAETWERVGRLYLQARKLDQAVAAFRKAQTACPEGATRLSYNLAQVASEQGKLAEALGYVDAYLRLQPGGTDAYELKISLLEKLHREGEVVPWLERAANADNHNLGLKLLLARQCAKNDRPAQAERLYQELAESNPNPDVYRALFTLYRDNAALGMGKALTLLNRALEEATRKEKPAAGNAAPAQARAMLALLREDAGLSKELLRVALPRLDDAELRPETLRLLAALADRGNLLAEAERCFRRCLKGVRPDNEALVYGGLLRVLWKGHKYEEIAKVCQEGLRTTQATNHVLFHGELARALSRQGKNEEAVKAADEAVRLAADPDRLSTRTLRVRVLTQARRFEKAETECQALLKEATEPGEVLEVRYLLSNLHSTAGNYPKAEEQLQLILKADPNNATACNDLGYLWADQGKKLEEAEKLIRKALELDRQQRKGRPGTDPDADHDNAAYIDSLGWVLFRRGQCEEARRELEKAVAQPEGEDPVVWDHLGDVYSRLQMSARAQTAWETAVRLFEQEHRGDLEQRFQDVRRKLKRLESELQH